MVGIKKNDPNRSFEGSTEALSIIGPIRILSQMEYSRADWTSDKKIETFRIVLFFYKTIHGQLCNIL